MTPEPTPTAGRLRLAPMVAGGPAYGWRIQTPTSWFRVTGESRSMTVRELLAQHGAEVLEVQGGIDYRPCENTLGMIINSLERPATRPQPEPMMLGTDAVEVWSGPGPVRVKFGNRDLSTVSVDLFHAVEARKGCEVKHHHLYQHPIEPGQTISQVFHPQPGRKLYARASMSGAVSVLCELVKADLDATLDHNDRTGFDMVYTGSGAASERLRRIVVHRTGALFSNSRRSPEVTIDDCRQAVIAELAKGGAWVHALDAAPDAAAPLSPGDNGPLHAKFDASNIHFAEVDEIQDDPDLIGQPLIRNRATGERFYLRRGETVTDGLRRVDVEGVRGWGDWCDPPYGVKLLTADDDHTADVVDAANDLNEKVRAARGAGLRVVLGIRDADGEVSVSVQRPPPTAPEPDPDLIAAREIVAGVYLGGGHIEQDWAENVRKGLVMADVARLVAAGIKRGRELAAAEVVNVDAGPGKVGHPVKLFGGVWAIYTANAGVVTSAEVFVAWTGPQGKPGAAVYWNAAREAYSGESGWIMPGWEWRGDRGEGLAVVWVP